MKIAIICAMKEELSSIVSHLVLSLEVEEGNTFKCYTASYNNIDLVLVLCGIGKVNAAAYTQYIITKYLPDYVINVGVAGGLSAKLNFGDLVIATDLVHHDMDVTAFDLPLGQIPRMGVFAFACDTFLINHANAFTGVDYQVVTGRVITGDQFIDDTHKAKCLNEQFNALACEMEGAAIAQVCHINQVPFLVIRSLSDMAGQHDKAAIHSFKELKDMVADRSSAVVVHLLKRLV